MYTFVCKCVCICLLERFGIQDGTSTPAATPVQLPTNSYFCYTMVILARRKCCDSLGIVSVWNGHNVNRSGCPC